jgi:hypothetical protein
MSRPTPRRKVFLFGLLGALGCLGGASAGEWLIRWSESLRTTQGTAVITRAPTEPPSLPAIPRPVPPAADLPATLPASAKTAPPPPPREVAIRLGQNDAHVGNIEITLMWHDYNDLDLYCIDSQDILIWARNRRSPTGGELDLDMNSGLGGLVNKSQRPIEHIYWRDGRVPLGHYKVYVVKAQDFENGRASEFVVDVKVGDKRYTSPTRRIQGVWEKQLVYEFDVEAPRPRLRLAVPPELVIDQGGTNRFRARIARDNFDGPVTIRLEGDLDGIVTKEVVIPAGSSEAALEVSAEDFARDGSRRLRVVAQSPRVEPVSLPMAVEVRELPEGVRLSAPPEIAVPQGQTNSLTFKIARDHYLGTVAVRCEGETEGLEAPVVLLKPDRDQGEFRFTAAKDAPLTTRGLELVAVAGQASAQVRIALTIEPGTIKAEVTWAWFDVAQSAAWTALIALGLALLLTVAQGWYLTRAFRLGRALVAAVGGMLAGAVAGGSAQALVGVLSARDGAYAKAGFVAAWMLLGLLLGRGLGLVIPNLKAGRAALAGTIGGGFGAGAFLAGSVFGGEVLSRFAGAAILGLCIGSMVVLVEVLFRKYWLEVRFGPREIRLINLGDAPVSVGSNGKICTVWTPTAAPVALTYTLRGGHLTCTNAVSGQTDEIRVGDRRMAGSVEVIACGAGAVEMPITHVPPPPRPAPARAPVGARPGSSGKSETISGPPPVSEPDPIHRSGPAPTPSRTTTPANTCPTCGRPLPASSSFCMICD